MEQTRFKFEWESPDGMPTTTDPNLFSSLASSVLSVAASQSSAWSVVTSSAFQNVSSIDTRLTDRLEAIERRLAILNLDADPTHQMLETLYKKYKMVEALIGEQRDNNE